MCIKLFELSYLQSLDFIVNRFNFFLWKKGHLNYGQNYYNLKSCVDTAEKKSRALEKDGKACCGKDRCHGDNLLLRHPRRRTLPQPGPQLRHLPEKTTHGQGSTKVLPEQAHRVPPLWARSLPTQMHASRQLHPLPSRTLSRLQKLREFLEPGDMHLDLLRMLQEEVSARSLSLSVILWVNKRIKKVLKIK